eukprot:gene21119-23190_t
MADKFSTSKPTKRGIVTCSGCFETFSSRWKPEKCTKCHRELGGKYNFSEKKQKCSDFGCVRINNESENQVELLSITTSKRDTRVFALNSPVAEKRLCYHEKCLSLRGVHVASSNLEEFSCDHLKLAADCTEPIYRKSFSQEEISLFPVAEKVKNQMMRNQEINSPTVVKISPKNYAVKCKPSASQPIAYCHVRVDESQPTNLLCLCRECKNKRGSTKQVKRRVFCIHLHYAILARKIEEKVETEDFIFKLNDNVHREPTLSWESDLQSLGLSRASTMKLQLKREIPYIIPADILQFPNNIGFLDNVFTPQNINCDLCGSPLDNATFPNGSRSAYSEDQYLLTSRDSFRKIAIKTKKCSNSECKAVCNLFPYEQGLFNVCNKVLLAIDVMVGWREGLKEGFPVTNMIDATGQCPEVVELQYISKLLYNGFYSFEAMTVRNMNDTICGFCGIIGELYCGDGNAKNCCSLHQVSKATDDPWDSCDPLPNDKNKDCTKEDLTDEIDDENVLEIAVDDVTCGTSANASSENSKRTGSQAQEDHLDNVGSGRLEAMLQKIKLHLVEKSTYAKSKLKFLIPMNEIPPIIPPMQRKAELNTETSKKSVYLKDELDGKDGDPVMLSKYIKDNDISVADFDSMNKEELTIIAQYCKTATSGVSTDKLRHNLQALYATILVGSSPCHAFTKSEGHTGGFYHLVCRHGCTVASKFLILTESVRDAADLYLSLRHPPITFICDTACTFVRHVNIREPAVARDYWGAYDGCFEIPSAKNKPNSGISVPAIVPLEYRASNIEISGADKREHLLFVSGGNPHSVGTTVKMLQKLCTMTKFVIHINDIKRVESIDEFLLQFHEGLQQGSKTGGMAVPMASAITVSSNDSETTRYISDRLVYRCSFKVPAIWPC